MLTMQSVGMLMYPSKRNASARMAKERRDNVSLRGTIDRSRRRGMLEIV